eukprot:3854557-Prymnesium_polylepis.1
MPPVAPPPRLCLPAFASPPLPPRLSPGRPPAAPRPAARPPSPRLARWRARRRSCTWLAVSAWPAARAQTTPRVLTRRLQVYA